MTEREEVILHTYSAEVCKTDLLDYHHCVTPAPPASSQIFAVTKFLQQTLRQYIEHVQHQDGLVKPLFIQLTYALKYLHDSNKIVVDEIDDIGKNFFKFSENGKYIALHRIAVKQRTGPTTGDNIERLGKLFGFILCGKAIDPESIAAEIPPDWQDREIAADLIRRMCDNETPKFHADDVLKHPYFWSPMKKVRFLCSVWDLYKSGEHMQKNLENEISPDIENWKNNLVVEEENGEMDEQICADAIKELLEISESRYDHHSPVFELLHFIRNCSSHYWSNSFHGNPEPEETAVFQNARIVFRSEHEGFWSFFNRKFPSFFITVYNYAETVSRMREKLGTTGYFDEIALFRDLM